MYSCRMNDVQEVIAALRDKGWTQQAIADELGVTWLTAHRWESGQTYPPTSKPVLMALDTLMKRKPPQRRRYPGTHHRQRKRDGSGDGDDDD